jgi:hypothetical protein
MTFDLDEQTQARQAAARRVAADVVAPVAAAFDRTLALPSDAVGAVRAVLAPAADPVGWVVGIEAVAAASVSVTLAAAGEALGRPALIADAQWSGCRGVDLDGLASSLSDSVSWHLAVSAVLVGAAAAAIRRTIEAMRAEAAPDGPAVAVPELSDAAAAVDAARLLLWDAARQAGSGAGPALPRHLARVQALDALTLAYAAAERGAGADAFRPGAVLERLRRDATTVALVAGHLVAEREAVAAGTLPG